MANDLCLHDCSEEVIQRLAQGAFTMAAFESTKGTTQDFVGKVTKNRRLQAKGKLNKAKGTVKRTAAKGRRRVAVARTKSRVKRTVKK